jgi:hypothetical protein
MPPKDNISEEERKERLRLYLARELRRELPEAVLTWRRTWTVAGPPRGSTEDSPQSTPTPAAKPASVPQSADSAIAKPADTRPTPATTQDNTQTEETAGAAPFSIPWEKVIPKDSQALRATPLYKTIYKLVQYQRDDYLVGSEYAQWRRLYRDTQPPDQQLTADDDLPANTKALSVQQLVPITSNFIVSPTMHTTALPWVTGALAYPRGALYPIAVDSLVWLGLSQQTYLDKLMKDQLLSMLKSPTYRHQIKSSTQGYMKSHFHFPVETEKRAE